MHWANSYTYNIYTAHMNPTLYVLLLFEGDNAIEIRKWNNVKFLPGTATYSNTFTC